MFDGVLRVFLFYYFTFYYFGYSSLFLFVSVSHCLFVDAFESLILLFCGSFFVLQ